MRIQLPNFSGNLHTGYAGHINIQKDYIKGIRSEMGKQSLAAFQYNRGRNQRNPLFRCPAAEELPQSFGIGGKVIYNGNPHNFRLLT